MKRAVIDIETLGNCFTLTALDYDSDNYKQFVISDYQNDFQKMNDFLFSIEYFIGFNSISFDETVLMYILDKGIKTAPEIYKVAQDVIAYGDNFELNEKFRKYKYNKPWKSIDLYLYWSKNIRIQKKLSLKYFQANLSLSIIEMPIHHSTTEFTQEQIDLILSYNLNDCISTKALAKEPIPDIYGVTMKEKINLRVWVKSQYNLDCLSWDSPKIASELLLENYCQKTWDKVSDYNSYKKKIRNTKYEKTPFRNGDYLPKINFKTKIFQDLYEEICNSYNGFSKEIIFKRFNGTYIKITYGSGGIHSTNREEAYKTNDNEYLYTTDVQSMYPNLLINYKFIREDLYYVLEKYRDVKFERVEAKQTKNKQKDAFLKLILNALTGLLDNEHSWMYSPAQIMALRLTGQLLLTRLLEESDLNGFLVFSQNTDGQEVIVPKNREVEYLNIVSIVEKEFDILFEHDKYEFINYGSVNDYIAKTISNKIKVKGEFKFEREIDGSNEFLVIPIALKEYFVNNIPIETTIKNHKNIFDFCSAKKIDKKYTVFHNNQKVQQLNRFYCSKKGAYLYKQKEDKSTMEHVFGESGVQIINVPPDNFPDDIDYQYYINSARKKIKYFQKDQLSLL